MFLKFTIEILAVLLLLYGYLNEDKVIEWEDKQIARIRALWASWEHGKRV